MIHVLSQQVNGTVCPSKASLTPTLSSRLHTLWRHISKSRTHFETTPDTGLFQATALEFLLPSWYADTFARYSMQGEFKLSKI